MSELRQFPIHILLKNGETIEDNEHELCNWYSCNVLECNSYLNKKLKQNENATIYIDEERKRVWTELPDGTTFTSIGKAENL